MKFGIVIKHDRRNIRLRVEMISDDGVMAFYKVIARNQSFTLQTNRPLLIGKGLKYKKPTWKISDGSYPWPSIIERIVDEIERKLNED